MKRFLVLVFLLVFAAAGCTPPSHERASNSVGSSAPFTFRVLTTGLADPWEINWGPDGFLWVTEKAGKRVTRINPVDGSKSTVITIADVYSTQSQDGLLGMAFQPDFLRGNNGLFAVLSGLLSVRSCMRVLGR